MFGLCNVLISWFDINTNTHSADGGTETHCSRLIADQQEWREQSQVQPAALRVFRLEILPTVLNI